jgi:hypothetical protein
MNTLQREEGGPFDGVHTGFQFLTLIGLFAVFIVLFTAIGQFIAIGITHENIDLNRLSDPKVVLGLKIVQITSALGGFIVPAIICTILISRRPINYMGLNKTGNIGIMLLGGIIMLLAFPLINYLGELNSRLQLPPSMKSIQDLIQAGEDEANKISNAFILHQSAKDLLLNLFMMAFVAAVAEELFFRATLQKMLIKGTGNIHIGIWLTAIIFSAVHAEFFGFVPRMLMGAYLGYLFVWSGSIWVPIFAHFLNNGTVVFISFLEERNLVSKKIEDFGNNSSQFGYVMVSTVIVAILVYVIYKVENKKEVIIIE